MQCVPVDQDQCPQRRLTVGHSGQVGNIGFRCAAEAESVGVGGCKDCNVLLKYNCIFMMMMTVQCSVVTLSLGES